MKKIKQIITITLLITTLFSYLVSKSEKSSYQQHENTITIIGTGYVGLVTGAGLAELGNTIICADIDSDKIFRLQQGKIPIYEPGLEKLVFHNVTANRLFFTDNIAQAIQEASIIFVAVNTPMSEDGAADLTAIRSVVQSIAQHINNYKIIVIKSTVPIGTGQQVRAMLEQQGVAPALFDIVSNPEFLREGCAVNDFLKPDRLVIGTESDKALTAICKVYEPLITRGTPHVLTNTVTAEITKYAANAFLATKISFINEIANLCDFVEADTQTVALALGLDNRINPKFLKFGPGFGGSCFPKDTEALLYTAQQHGINLYTVTAAIQANKVQQKKPAEKLFKLMKNYFPDENLAGKTVAILGLAFKANTDDIRYSPAIKTISLLLQQGINIKAYDPAAMQHMQQLFPTVTYCPSLYEAVTDADAIIVMTEWDEFKQLDIDRITKLMKNHILVDARNILNPLVLKQKGFICDTIGQSYLCLKKMRAKQQLTKSYRMKLNR